jgi:predicted RNase H-like HicB family nuclease
MERYFQYVVFEEDDAYVARCLDVEVASEGDTQIGAIANLCEALELYFENCPANFSDLPSRTYRFGELTVHV